MSLAESLERAAVACPEDADEIRPANGDPSRLFQLLEPESRERVLLWLLSNQAEQAQELAEAWLEESEGLTTIVSLSTEELPKEGRKVLRRLIHRARSQGNTVEPEQDAESHVARLPHVDESISVGFLSPYDPRGGRLVYIVESNPAGGAQVFEALIDEDRGIVDFQVYRAGRRQVKSFIRDVTHRGRFSATETEAATVRALIARGAERQSESQKIPASFKEWRSRLQLDARGVQTPGERVIEALSEEAGEDDLSALREKVKDGEIGPWPPQPPVLEAVVGPIRESFQASAGESTDEEEMADAMKEAIGTCYGGALAEVNAERLAESAYLYWQQGEDPLARACLTSAKILKGDGVDLGPVTGECIRVVTDALVSDLKEQRAQAVAASADTQESA